MGRLIRRSPHAAGNLGDAIPRLLGGAGFDVTEVATRRQRVVGTLTFYRATRPASAGDGPKGAEQSHAMDVDPM